MPVLAVATKKGLEMVGGAWKRKKATKKGWGVRGGGGGGEGVAKVMFEWGRGAARSRAWRAREERLGVVGVGVVEWGESGGGAGGERIDGGEAEGGGGQWRVDGGVRVERTKCVVGAGGGGGGGRGGV